MPARRRGEKVTPPVFTHEWVIQNHGDIAACVAVFFVLGLMFQFTKNAANYFIALQYPKNDTSVNTESIMHEIGPQDVCTVSSRLRNPLSMIVNLFFKFQRFERFIQYSIIYEF